MYRYARMICKVIKAKTSLASLDLVSHCFGIAFQVQQAIRKPNTILII